MMYGFNKLVATEPFKDKEIKLETKGGFATIAQKTTLASLKVICGNHDNTVPSGSTIYLTGESFKQPWANKVFNLNGTNVILVPEEAILMVQVD